MIAGQAGPAWESSDEAYACLRDTGRVQALGASIEHVVGPADVVLDAGSGTGILALLAARAGARRVYAVEGDPMLARCLVETAAANGYADVIVVVEGDVREAALPEPVDVVVAEMIDTGLIGESLVPFLSSIGARGLARPGARVIPRGYETTVQPARTRDEPYGFRIAAPRHEWSYLRGADYLPSEVEPLGEPVRAWRGELALDGIDPDVRVDLELPAEADALLITGRMDLPGVGWAGAFPSLNGPKVVSLWDRPRLGGRVEVRYSMGGGLQTVRARPVGAASR